MRRKDGLLEILPDGGGAPLSARSAVLALGNPARAEIHPRLVANVFGFDFSVLAGHRGPVALIGSGLTAIDTLLSLRANGYRGQVLAFSRHGLLPLAHAEPAPPRPPALEDAPRPAALMRALRAEARAAAPWQAAVDGLRGRTSGIWRSWTPGDRARFLARQFTLWNIHRHRMPTEIARLVAAERDSGLFPVIAGHPEIETGGHALGISCAGSRFEAVLGFDCRGPAHNARHCGNPFLLSLLESGLAAPHETGMGLSLDEDFRLPGPAKAAPVFALGPAAMGALLESTAVPELRLQAERVAAGVLSALSP
jgi:uncharacterized NAD(P)/FAD-binding protein YdhS